MILMDCVALIILLELLNVIHISLQVLEMRAFLYSYLIKFSKTC